MKKISAIALFISSALISACSGEGGLVGNDVDDDDTRDGKRAKTYKSSTSDSSLTTAQPLTRGSSSSTSSSRGRSS